MTITEREGIGICRKFFDRDDFLRYNGGVGVAVPIVPVFPFQRTFVVN